MNRIDRRTVEAYELWADRWSAERAPRHTEAIAWLEAARTPGLPVVDLGCGPGWNLESLRAPSIGLDATKAMLRLSRQRFAGSLLQASAGDLPFAPGSLGAAVASRVYTHLPSRDNPAALADLHRCLAPDAPVIFDFTVQITDDPRPERWAVDERSGEPFPDRLGSRWTDPGLRDLLEGAGFVVDEVDDTVPGLRGLQARRRLTLPDFVGPDMAVLVCGLNPSIHAARAGLGFVTANNRFWSGALAAGLVSVDREPFVALDRDGVGMTDLVKRATRRADELDGAEYRAGLARVERLVAWLQPRVVCFVGLSGWRAAVDRRATAGVQAADLAGRPVYVMPSTSGLNAHCQLPEVIEHFVEVRRLSARV